MGTWACREYYSSTSSDYIIFTKERRVNAKTFMTKIYLIPPSETKRSGWELLQTQRAFGFKLPKKLAISASPTDLKCKDKRYAEAITLNRSVEQSELLPAISRYTGIMHAAIWYDTMHPSHQSYFDDRVLIVSGMYGLIKPQDMIGNYKLPIDSKGLQLYRYKLITKALLKYCREHQITQIINLLPQAHQKVIDWKKLQKAGIEIIEQEFMEDGKKMAHGVKKVKGEWLRNEILGDNQA